MRFKVMMYDDGEGEFITPDEVMDLMEDDVKEADLVVWVGISFEQSASTSYFRNVRRWLQEEGYRVVDSSSSAPAVKRAGISEGVDEPGPSAAAA